LAATAPAQAALVANTVTVNQGSNGQLTITGAPVQAASLVNFQFTSTYATADPEIFQLRNGVTLAQMDSEIVLAGQGGQTAATAMQWFNQNTTFFGGLSAAGTVSFHLILPVGAYYVAQMNPSATVKPSTTAKQFLVVGAPHAIQPVVDQTLKMLDVTTDRFTVETVSGQLHRGQVTISNHSSEMHFVRFVQVQPGTTKAQVDAWLAGGSNPTVPGGSVESFGTTTPYHLALLDLNVVAGTYAVLDFIPDDVTGVPHSLQGMTLVVTVS
jgi:hypothetical protein